MLHIWAPLPTHTSVLYAWSHGTNVYNGSSFQTPDIAHFTTYSCTSGLWLCLHHWDSPFPFKWVQEKVVSSHWIRPGSCDPFTETRQLGGLQTTLKSRYPTVWYTVYDWGSCVFNACIDNCWYTSPRFIWNVTITVGHCGKCYGSMHVLITVGTHPEVYMKCNYHCRTLWRILCTLTVQFVAILL